LTYIYNNVSETVLAGKCDWMWYISIGDANNGAGHQWYRPTGYQWYKPLVV